MRSTFAFIVAVVATWLAAGCSYNPQFKDGELKCSLSGDCPAGYVCRANACFSSGGGGDAGATDDSGSTQVLLNRYLGDWSWTMDSLAAVTNHCDDGTTYTNKLNTSDVMTIAKGTGGQADLDASWLCDHLSLRLNATGGHLDTPVPNCRVLAGTPDTSGITTTSTWSVMKFEVFTANGTTLTHTAAYTRVDRSTSVDTTKPVTVLTCSQTVAATLTKN